MKQRPPLRGKHALLESHNHDLAMHSRAPLHGSVLELFNDTLRAQPQLAAEYKHVAVEIPLGSLQIKYSARAYQWSPRGAVLRCLVEDDENGQLVVGID